MLFEADFHPEQSGNILNLNTNFSAKYRIGNEEVIVKCILATNSLSSLYNQKSSNV